MNLSLLDSGIIEHKFNKVAPAMVAHPGAWSKLSRSFDMSILSLLSGGKKKYLFCVKCGSPKITKSQKKSPLCMKCYRGDNANPIINGSKRCSRCRKNKPVTEFYKHKSQPNGLRSHCKVCELAEAAQWREDHRVKPRKEPRRILYPACVSCGAPKTTIGSQKRPLCLKCFLLKVSNPIVGGKRACSICGESKPLSEFRKRSKNKSGLDSRCKQCANEADSITVRDRRTRIYSTGGHVSYQDWREVLNRYGNNCLCCGASKRIERDHIVPLSRGGMHHKSNLQPLCRTCNTRKGTRTIDYRYDKGASWKTE